MASATATNPNFVPAATAIGPDLEVPRAVSHSISLPVSGSSAEPSGEFLSRVPREFARRHLILSLGRVDGTERLAVTSETSPAAIHNTRVHLSVPCTTAMHDPEWLAAEIDRCFGREGPVIDVEARPTSLSSRLSKSELAVLAADADRDLLSTQGKGPVVKLVDAILFEALTMNASDVHIQPLREGTLVRYRIDGVLHDTHELPTTTTLAVVSRIKVMGKMDVAERRVAQDGRATVTIGSGKRAERDVEGYVRDGGGANQPFRGQDRSEKNSRHERFAEGDRSEKNSRQEPFPRPPPSGRGCGRDIDLRISSFPTSYGERVVLRLLDQSRATHLTDFAHLGMPAAVEAAFLERAGRASGILLVTGPTGSGKTTTLYATLRWIAMMGMSRTDTDAQSSVGGAGNVGTGRGVSERGRGLNVMTIEDPIEYELSTGGKDTGLGISQSQVNLKKGVSFATGLRHILRQDPDVIMVGEIRDAETARIAIQASLTGHLVFSTLHTNDAAGAVTRLADLGVEPYLTAASLSAVLAQRLVRSVHGECGGAGCEGCLRSGFKGRIGVFEYLPIDESVRAIVTRAGTAADIRARAKELGMRTLMEEGERLVREGVTSVGEVARVIHGAE